MFETLLVGSAILLAIGCFCYGLGRGRSEGREMRRVLETEITRLRGAYQGLTGSAFTRPNIHASSRRIYPLK